MSSSVISWFYIPGIFAEQEMALKDQPKDVTININAPLQFNRKGKTYLVIFALPNDNSIEWTKGKKIQMD